VKHVEITKKGISRSPPETFVKPPSAFIGFRDMKRFFNIKEMRATFDVKDTNISRGIEGAV
jgi:hypothetical protein